MTNWKIILDEQELPLKHIHILSKHFYMVAM